VVHPLSDKSAASAGPAARSKTVVCHVTTVHRPLDDRIFYRECLSLVQAGYEVHLVARHDWDEIVEGVHLHALPTPAGRVERMLRWPLKASAAVLRTGAAVVHFHDPELIPMGLILRHLLGARVIFDIHENIAGQMRTKPYLSPLMRRVLAGAYRLVECFGLMDIAIVESDMVEGKYRQPKQSVRNLPIKGRLASPPRTLRDFQGKPTLIYAGGISVDRGAFHLLHLAEALGRQGVDFQMKIVGSASPELTRQMQTFIAERGLGDKVAMTGQVTFPQSLELIRASTVGLCLLEATANYRYALPIKILEYMAFGLPVVSTDLPCSAAYVRQARAGILVDVTRPEEVARQVAELLADPQRMLQMGTRGRQAVQTDLCWENEAPRLLRLYERLLTPWAGTEWGQDMPLGPYTIHCPRGARL
jgi:glycosyltransferase involved in cell wall biosynthesis